MPDHYFYDCISTSVCPCVHGKGSMINTPNLKWQIEMEGKKVFVPYHQEE